MRSRYTAFVKNEEAYLLKTWHPSTRPESLVLDEPVKWLSLKIKSSSMSDETHGSVHFITRGLIGGHGFKQEENSSFVLEDGQWYYVDGKLS